MGASLYKLCVPSAFGGKAGFDMDAKYIFPQEVYWRLPLWYRVWLEMEGARFEPGLSLCSVASVRCGIRSQAVVAEALGVEQQAGSVPLMCVFSSLPTLGPLPWSQGSAKAGARVGSRLMLATENCPGCVQCTACLDIHNCSLISQMQLCVQAPFVTYSGSLTPAVAAPALLWIHTADGQGPHGLFACIGAEAAAARVAGCFQCSTRESANDHHPAPPELRLRYGHLSICRLIFIFWHIKYSSHYVSKMK